MTAPEASIDIQQEDLAPHTEIADNQFAINMADAPPISVAGVSSVEGAQDQIYNRTHSNGQEFSGTLDEARKLCPVLGRMTIENAQATLQETDLASRIAQRGRERRRAEAAKLTENENKGVREKETTEAEIEKILPVPAVISKPDNAMPGNIKYPDEHDLHFIITRHAEATNRDDGSSEVAAAVSPVSPKAAARSEKLKTNVVDEEVFTQTDQEIIEALKPQEDLGNTKHVVSNVSERKPIARLPVKSSKQQHEVTIASVSDAAITPQSLRNNEQRQPNERGTTPGRLEIADELIRGETDAVDEMAAELIGVAGYGMSESDITVSITQTLAQPYLEIAGGEVVSDREVAPQLATVGGTETNLFNERAALAVPELPAPVRQIEDAMVKLVGIIESDEAGGPGEIDVILEKVIAMSPKLESATGEETEVLEATLEELYVDLFEAAGIDCSPELVTSFVRLTRSQYLEELTKKHKTSDEESQIMPDEIGTREFLQKLQHGLIAMKHAVINFYEIGKSIVRLYAYQPVTSALELRT